MTALPDYAHALELALSAVDWQCNIESVEVSAACGRVLAEAIVADRDLPPFDRAMMDGYALRAAEYSADKEWPVVHQVAAGASPCVEVPPRTCVAIATGAALPADVDAVIQHELSDRNNPVRFTQKTLAPGSAVHRRGSDAAIGDELIHPGTALSAHHIGVCCAVGRTKINVRAQPRAIVLTSGDEVLPPQTNTNELLAHQIRNSNGPMVCELLQRFGASPMNSQHVPDERDASIQSVRAAIDHADVVVTVGGVSAGERDHFPAAFDANGVVPTLSGASIQPGRPIFIGRAANGAIVIGLPGNPVSVLACACLFLWPIVWKLLGVQAALPWRDVTLADEVKPNAHRRAFRPAILHHGDKATVPTWAGSGDLAHTVPTHGLIELPVQQEPVAKGTRLRFLPWP